MAGSSTDYSGAWDNVKFDPGAYSSGVDLGGSSYGSSFPQYQMPGGWDVNSDNIGGFSTKDAYGGGFNLGSGSRSSSRWQDTWDKTNWGKALTGLNEFIKRDPRLGRNMYSSYDPYGKGNAAWGTPPNASTPWESLGATIQQISPETSVIKYPGQSYQVGYQPGTPGSRGWGSAIVSGLGMAFAPFTGGLSAAIAAPISTGMGIANV